MGHAHTPTRSGDVTPLDPPRIWRSSSMENLGQAARSLIAIAPATLGGFAVLAMLGSGTGSTRAVELVAGSGAALSVVFALWLAASQTEDLARVRSVAELLASGDLRRSTGMMRHDELGRSASAVDSAVLQLRSVIAQLDTAAAAVESTGQAMAEAAVGATAGREASEAADAVAGTAEQVSRHLQAVAAAVEQMTASIEDISQNANQAVGVATKAAEVAEVTNGTVARLGASSTEIGNVVKAITQIAEQTNLLALNATIEAARAGDAGRGFAVVAGEVKELAQETARATDDITRRVAAIQDDTTAAVQAIAQITAIIAQISEYQMTIASAVEEQTATTNEMSRGVADAAAGSAGIASDVVEVASAARRGATVLDQLAGQTRGLPTLSARLREHMDAFRL